MSPTDYVYAGLQPAEVWRHFYALNQRPRPSGQEDAARAYVLDVASQHQAVWKVDSRGNCLVRLPERGGSPTDPIVCIQSHLDMVCQHKPEVTQDFSRDPIVPRVVGDRVYATGTTLGADNGLGVALALALITSPHLHHGPLELLFTVEEETGLFGAQFLDPDMVHGRLLVNLDSEDPEEITIGCAGGAGTSLHLPVAREELGSGWVIREVKVNGLQGGHSGVQIHEKLGNALQFLADLLDRIQKECPGLCLMELSGGTAHNAIPRDAGATVAVPEEEAAQFETGFEAGIRALCSCWHDAEPGLSMSQATAMGTTRLNLESTRTALALLRELPHGVHQMSQAFPGKVETSCNLAEAVLGTSSFELHVSNRSFLAAELAAAQERVAAVARRHGADIEVRDGYPGWEPRQESPLRTATEAAFLKVRGEPARVEVVHAGLECGILSQKLMNLDAVSFGPLIRGAHTPEEYADIASVDDIWRVLIQLISDVATPPQTK